MGITTKALALGLATRIPGLRRLDGRATGGTDSARYCYAVWMRHLSVLRVHGLSRPLRAMVELGPGDSIGVGIAALLSGVERYTALDANPYASTERNLRILDELVELFGARAPIPDQHEFPGMFPRLDSHAFPSGALGRGWEAMLSEERLNDLRASIRAAASGANPNAQIRYIAPWSPVQISDDSVDLTISQTVLQLVDDLPGVYQEMARWTRPGGVISHEIDFKSYERTREWNGHWACSDAMWSLMQDKRTNRINREPCSSHMALMKAVGFEVLVSSINRRPSGIDRSRLAPRFSAIDEADLTTASALIQAVKNGHGDAA